MIEGHQIYRLHEFLIAYLTGAKWQVTLRTNKGDFVINVTTVLPPSGGVGLQAETFSGSAKVSLRPSRVPRDSKGQGCRMIPD